MKSSYGLSGGELATLADLHRKAKMNHQGDLLAFIEEGLTNFNYHTFCGLLRDGRYETAILRVTLHG